MRATYFISCVILLLFNITWTYGAAKVPERGSQQREAELREAELREARMEEEKTLHGRRETPWEKYRDERDPNSENGLPLDTILSLGQGLLNRRKDERDPNSDSSYNNEDERFNELERSPSHYSTRTKVLGFGALATAGHALYRHFYPKKSGKPSKAGLSKLISPILGGLTALSAHSDHKKSMRRLKGWEGYKSKRNEREQNSLERVPNEKELLRRKEEEEERQRFRHHPNKQNQAYSEIPQEATHLQRNA